MAADPFFKPGTGLGPAGATGTPELRQQSRQYGREERQAKQASIQSAARATLAASRAEGGTPLTGEELYLTTLRAGGKGSGAAAATLGLSKPTGETSKTEKERDEDEDAVRQARLAGLMQVLAARSQGK